MYSKQCYYSNMQVHVFVVINYIVIQNADDARATEVKFFLDCHRLQVLPPTLVPVDKHDDISQFIAPALLSYNNAPFKKEDWESIQSLQLSGKAKNPHKVGKFGIGFNSVYHSYYW